MVKNSDEFQSSIIKTIVLTSFIWLIVGAGFYHTLFNIRTSVSITDECQSRINSLEMQLAENQEIYTNLVKMKQKKIVEDNESFVKEYKILPKIDTKPKSLEELIVEGPELENQKREGDNSEWRVEDFSNEPKNPPDWPGENGKAVIIPENLKESSKERFKENEFDIVASDLIALNRSIPDVRSDSYYLNLI